MPDFNLDRFKKAQTRDYATALSEIKNGRKESHWMWYIFPQLKGLGFSSMAEFYGIDGLAEAKAYIADDLLRGRLVEISEALLSLPSSDAREVMPDSRLTEPSDGKVFRLREAIILSKKLGRPLTKEEMEEFTL